MGLMSAFQNRRNRKSIRRKGHNYTKPGLYFVTICIQDRAQLLGKIVDDKMNLSDTG